RLDAKTATNELSRDCKPELYDFDRKLAIEPLEIAGESDDQRVQAGNASRAFGERFAAAGIEAFGVPRQESFVACGGVYLFHALTDRRIGCGGRGGGGWCVKGTELPTLVGGELLLGYERACGHQ